RNARDWWRPRWACRSATPTTTRCSSTPCRCTTACTRGAGRRPREAPSGTAGIRRLERRPSPEPSPRGEGPIVGQVFASATVLQRSAALLAEARVHQFRRARGSDRGDAPGAGGAHALDLGTPLPARAQLLHGAAGPGG